MPCQLQPSRPLVSAEIQARENLSVDKLAEVLYPGVSYDVALPQMWVDDCSRNKSFDPRGMVVWGYPTRSNIFGDPLPLTIEAQDFLTEHYWDK